MISSPSIRRMTSVHASAPERWIKNPPDAESTSVPDEEVASTPEESRWAHPVIGDYKCTQHTMDVKCTYIYSFRTRYRMTPTWLTKEFQMSYETYWIAYRMASRGTVEITTRRWSPRSHGDRYHCRRTSHGDREDYREPYRAKPLTKMHTEWRTEGSRNYRRTAYWTEYQCTLPEAYKWLPRSKRILYRCCLPRWHRAVDQERTEAFIRMTFTKKRCTETLMNAESRDGEIYKCNVQSGFLRAEALLLHGEYDLPRC